MKTLLFAPHPDDEIISCGGYLAKSIRRKNLVDIVYLTSSSPIRELEINKIKQFMGFNNVYLFNQEDRMLKTDNKLLKKLLKTIRDSKPDQIIIPHKNESDRDHKILSEILLDCVYLADSNFLLEKSDKPFRIKSILGYEVWTPISLPQLYIDITEFMQIKREAMKLYSS